MSKLIIVESPSKIKTLKKILGSGYELAASNGHVIDLPKNKLGIDVDNNFSPEYVVIEGREKILKNLKDLAKKSNEIILASDPDREGESIAWHIANYIKAPKKISRITFNEITERAVKEAIKNPKQVNMEKVHAQQARRLLDRLVGYKISPVLWKVMGFNTSAGRVQSVALRLICDLEDKIKDFKPEKYWEIAGLFDKNVELALHRAGEEKGNKVKSKEGLKDLEKQVGEKFKVEKYKVSKKKNSPPLPFETSTLQQAASSKLGFSPSRTMRVAQKLYEGIDIGGDHKALITYMRTDSTRVSGEARDLAGNYIKKSWGAEYFGKGKKVKSNTKGNVQDAHECIRPTYPLEPLAVAPSLTPEQNRLYELIFNRFMVSQMSDLEYDQLEVISSRDHFQFKGLFNSITFDGYYKVYKEGAEEFEKPFPKLKEGQDITLDKLKSKEGETKPPARYSEASLIKKLKAEGIGRPSTYASIVETLKKREYAELKEKKFFPTTLGYGVKSELTEHFKNIMDLKFTVKMEELLDKIAEGKEEWTNTMDYFYKDLMEHLDKFKQDVDSQKNRKIESDVKCDSCGSGMVLKSGRYGYYLECEDDATHKKSVPAQALDHSEVKKGFVHLQSSVKAAQKEREGIPTDVEHEGKTMILKSGRYGYYLECEDGEGNKHRKSIPKGIKISNEDLNSKVIHLAFQMEKIQREEADILKKAGPCEKCGNPMAIKRGKWGPFLGCSNYPECKNMKKITKKG